MYLRGMDSTPLIEFEKATFRFLTHKVFPDTQLIIKEGEHIAILGNNGSGKTTLGKAFTGILPRIEGKAHFHIPYDKIVFVSFSSVLKLSNSLDPYLQQRWNSTHTDSAPYVKDFYWPGQEIPAYANSLLKALDAESLLDKRNIALSNGELRKMELIKALSSQPKLLIIDNAFTGLDTKSREVLHQVLNTAAKECTIVLIALPHDPLPPFIQTKVFCQDTRIVEEIPKTTHLQQVPNFSPCTQPVDNKPLVKLKNVAISYDEYTLLKGINWRIQPREHWALMGPNGSGKSTLLSLLIGDNPQAYAREIYLFGKRKGSGESIWDIQRNIGFISPELHQFTSRTDRIEKILIKDKIWLYPGMDTITVRKQANAWFEWFGLGINLEKPFGHLSSGEQRLVLFIRTLLYPFRLLIADEPCQGLDEQHVRKVQAVFTFLAKSTHAASIFITHKKEELPPSTTHMFDMRKENEAMREKENNLSS